MFYASRKGALSTTRKQNSYISKTTKHEQGNETDGGFAEVLDTSREDLSPSRCSCQSGGSNVAVRSGEGGSDHFWSGNLRLEFDNNAGSDDEQLKDELLRIFDRERLGLESYFKQKTENILAGYRRKQYEWEEKIRLERMDHEKTLSQEKIEVQQNYISEMTRLTKQFNQERVELETHYKKQIEELSLQFDLRKKEMDATIVKERTELKERLELEYQAMLKSQKAADEERYNQQSAQLEENYKKILELEQKLKDSFSDVELSGQRLQSDLEAKFEQEKSLLFVEWRKRVELLEVELGKEKERANKEERKASECVGFLKNEISEKDIELEKLRQVVETLKVELSQKEKSAKERELLQQNIFLRGTDALPGKLREDFEKMLAVHRETLERNLREEREGLETEREARLVLERETIAKHLKLEREKMNLDMEKERSEMKQASREKEDRARLEVIEEMERMRFALENEKLLLREQLKEREEALLNEKRTRDTEIAREKEFFREHIRNKMIHEKQDEILRNKLKNERQEQNTDKRFTFEQHQGKKDLKKRQELVSADTLQTHSEGVKSERDLFKVRDQEGLGQNHVRFEAEEAERRRNALGGNEGEESLAGQKMQDTKQWVERQCKFAGDTLGCMEDSAEFRDDVQDRCDLDRNTMHTDKNHGKEVDKVYQEVRNDNHACMDGDNKQRRNEKELDTNTRNNQVARIQNKDPFKYEDDPENYDVASPINQEQPNKTSHVSSYPASRNPEKPDSREYSLRVLKEENEGLKAKVRALQENIALHECFKKEASEEVQRLRDTNKDLKIKLEGLKDILNDNEELKAALADCKKQLKDNVVVVKNNEEKIKEYEEICAEYERTLQNCRQRIRVIENDQLSSSAVENIPSAGRNETADTLKYLQKQQGIKNNDTGFSNGFSSSHDESRGEKPIDIKSLQKKIKLLDSRISEITAVNHKAATAETLTSNLERVRRQNKGLVKKVKDLQCQLQAMVDKLRKKKRKIACLKDENHWLKCSSQKEISDLQRKLKYSSEVITRLQNESSKETSNITHLKEQISNISKVMMEERVCEQRLLKAKSIEEIDKLRDLDREKVNLERKLNEAKTALHGYSERLREKMSHSLTSNQVRLNTETTSVEGLRLSTALKALEDSQRTSQRQNEELRHEKQELQTLMSRLCKSQEDLRHTNGFHKKPLRSCSSSLSSSSRTSHEGSEGDVSSREAVFTAQSSKPEKQTAIRGKRSHANKDL